MIFIRDKALLPIFEKVQTQTRLTVEDALTLYQSADLPAIGVMANTVKERISGNDVYFVINRHINYSNICKLKCMFCAFAKTVADADGYTYSLDEIYTRAQEAVDEGAVELHMVGGLHPDLPYEWYLEMLDGLTSRFPNAQLKCFTVVEIEYFASLAGMSVPAVLEDLKAHGLHSIPGGGAEILSDRVWHKLYKEKMGPDGWIDVQRMVHAAGIRSNATMLYGHIETTEECVEHLNRLRSLQDETNGFMTFIPLRFHPDYSNLKNMEKASALTSLKHIAIGRLFLDNFKHVKTYWTMNGLDTSQVALYYGADDFDGTVMEEKITQMAGGTSPQGLSVQQLCRFIEEAGRTPVNRDSVYNALPLTVT